MKNVLFTERQHFRQWWLWVILLGADLALFLGVYAHLTGTHAVGTDTTSDTVVLALVAVLTLLTTGLFAYLRLDTLIEADAVQVRFFPFHLTFRRYAWADIGKAYVRTYNPIGEYGGWGLRMGIAGRGNALNVAGNTGLQLEFTNGKKLLIGTQNPEELTRVLQKISVPGNTPTVTVG